MKKVAYIFISVFFLYVVSSIFLFGFNDSKDNNFQNNFIQGYKVFALNLPSNLNFAGENVPTANFEVREALDKELLQNVYYQSNTLLLFKRANRWFKVIEPILKKYNIPDDFKFVALVESNLTNVISPAGATGFWQFIEPTAKIYNLEVNEEVDERYNVEKSTEAACKYFLESYQTFKNWTLVAASYNMGIVGVKKQLDMQQVTSYYDLLLNQETARYVFRILAIKELFSHPRNYGYHIRKKDLYPYISTYKIELSQSVNDLATWAKDQKVNYKILKYFNPWLRKNTLTNKNLKTYQIFLPTNDVNIADYYPKSSNEEELIDHYLFSEDKSKKDSTSEVK